MIFNIGKNIPNFSRYNGGWIKTITEIDKDYKNGYSLVGEFLPVGSGNIDLYPGNLYLDCSIDGSRKHPERNYTLFKIVDKEVVIITHLENGGRDWAMSLWDIVESELGIVGESKVEEIFKQIQAFSSDERKQFFNKINNNRKLRKEFSHNINMSPKKLVSFNYEETIEFIEKLAHMEYDNNYDNCWFHIIQKNENDNEPFSHNIHLTESLFNDIATTTFSLRDTVEDVKNHKSDFIEAFIINTDVLYTDAWLFCEPELLNSN